MKVISINQRTAQSHSGSVKRQDVSSNAFDSGAAENSNEDYLEMALWFTKELQREYVGTNCICVRD